MIANPEVDFPPEEFVKEENVIVFDEHQGSRTVKGKPLVVDEEMLQRIANSINTNYEQKRSPVAVGLGHTIDDENAKESDQPPIVGWGVNAKVVPFFKTGKKALACDLYIRKEKADVIREYPGRSIELYPSTAEVPFLALLRKVPERTLPVIKFNRNDDRDRYYRTLFVTQPVSNLLDSEPFYFSRENSPMPMNPMMDAAVADEGKTNKSLEAKVDRLSMMFESLMSMLSEAVGQDEGDDDDLLNPADDADDYDDEDDKEDDKKKPAKKEDKKKNKEEAEVPDEEPVKMDASQPSATNTYTPNTEKDKAKMSKSEEALKYERRVQQLEKENREIKLKFAREKAEKTVAEWETKFQVNFPNAELREAEVELMTHLDDESFEAHQKRALLLYSRKTPAGAAVKDVQKFSRLDTGTPDQTMEDVQAEVDKIMGTYAQALKKVK